MRIILFGPPGSGKGTQGDLIAGRYGYLKISTGDLLRRAVQERTALGKKAEALMNRGKLVSDDIVEGLVRERIAAPDTQRGYLLDGFPRNLAQVHSLEAMDGGRSEVAIELDVDSPVLIERMRSRLTCRLCGAVVNSNFKKPGVEGRCDACGGELYQRLDDRPEVIDERFKVYEEETGKIKAHYKEKSVYRRVDGSGSVEQVFARISEVLDREKAGRKADQWPR
ncbi:MAG TPA: adenylate kinase [Candidatus Desulfaltia sp.]|nr:adenylate kinase [Candidatus Desulfaltia sp.]